MFGELVARCIAPNSICILLWQRQEVLEQVDKVAHRLAACEQLTLRAHRPLHLRLPLCGPAPGGDESCCCLLDIGAVCCELRSEALRLGVLSRGFVGVKRRMGRSSRGRSGLAWICWCIYSPEPRTVAIGSALAN